MKTTKQQIELNSEQNQELTEIYVNNHRLVSKVVAKFLRKFPYSFPEEDKDDLTQSCWENICKKYPKYDPEKSKMTTWIHIVSTNTLYTKIRDNRRDKRAVGLSSTSLDELAELSNSHL